MPTIESLIEWIKNNKIKTISIIIGLFLLPLIIVHLLFKWDIGCNFLSAEWSAGDLITYIAGFEACIGTVSLGAFALWQNKKFKESNDNKDKLFLQVENEKIRLSYLPQFLVQTANPEKCIDNRYQLSAQYADKYVPLNQFNTYGFIIKEDGCEWIPVDKYPIIQKGTENRISSIVNCGNNTAHQVKLSICIGNSCYSCEKSSSVQKDNEIFFYFGLNQKASVNHKIFLTIRFFDCFQNVYEQKFEIFNNPDFLYLISYGDVELIKRNKSMDVRQVIDKTAI